MEKLFKIKFSTNKMYHIRQKIDILVVAMQKFSLAIIFIRQINDFILISDIKYELNRTSLSYKKMTIRFCCFCLTATVHKTQLLGWSFCSIQIRFKFSFSHYEIIVLHSETMRCISYQFYPYPSHTFKFNEIYHSFVRSQVSGKIRKTLRDTIEQHFQKCHFTEWRLLDLFSKSNSWAASEWLCSRGLRPTEA